MATLTMGPLLFHWTPEQRRTFYARVADMPSISTVYLGEVVCSKRLPFFAKDLPALTEILKTAGKTVVLSTLSEVTVPLDRRAIREVCETTGCEIEVNDAAALLALEGRPFRIGQLFNCYNEETLRFLNGRGATHVCLPAELPATAIRVMGQAARELGMGVEAQVFGRLSLALSARCYHARAEGRSKDDCRFVCERDPDGLDLTTVEGSEFLAINGIQTLSHTYANLSRELGLLAECGVTHFRLSPHSCDMAEVARAYADLIASAVTPDDADRRIQAAMPAAVFANGFVHGRPGYLRV